MLKSSPPFLLTWILSDQQDHELIFRRLFHHFFGSIFTCCNNITTLTDSLSWHRVHPDRWRVLEAGSCVLSVLHSLCPPHWPLYFPPLCLLTSDCPLCLWLACLIWQQLSPRSPLTRLCPRPSVKVCSDPCWATHTYKYNAARNENWEGKLIRSIRSIVQRYWDSCPPM